MLLLYAVGVPYIWYTLTRWRTPKGHGLHWNEPSALIGGIDRTRSSYGGVVWDMHQKDLEWHPDDILRTSVTGQ